MNKTRRDGFGMFRGVNVLDFTSVILTFDDNMLGYNLTNGYIDGEDKLRFSRFYVGKMVDYVVISASVFGFAVEKLWGSLWESRWENCEKSCGKVPEGRISTFWKCVGRVLRMVVGKFSKGFTRGRTSVGEGISTISTWLTTITTTFLEGLGFGRGGLVQEKSVGGQSL